MMRGVLFGLLLGLAGMIGVELWPAGTAAVQPAAERAARPDPVAPDAAAPNAAALLEAALARPLFSRSRRPADAPAPAAEPSGLPRLSGIVIGPGGERAMFAAVGGGKPRAVGPGERVQAYRVRSIAAEAVTLEGPDGVLVLRPSYAKVGAVAAVPQQDDLPPGILPEDLASPKPTRPQP